MHYHVSVHIYTYSLLTPSLFQLVKHSLAETVADYLSYVYKYITYHTTYVDLMYQLLYLHLGLAYQILHNLHLMVCTFQVLFPTIFILTSKVVYIPHENK